MAHEQPQLWVIAGPNGSGKTTITKSTGLDKKLPVINPDEIAYKISPDDVSKASVQAGREAIRQQNNAFQEKNSFAIETTFSGNRERKLLSIAKAEGYKVSLVFVGLEQPIINVCRVGDRVSQGGHHISVKDIVRRYQRSMDNLKKAFPIIDRLYVLDNSSKRYRLCLVKDKDYLRNLSKNMPTWIEKALPEKEKTQYQILLDLEDLKKRSKILSVGKNSKINKKMKLQTLNKEISRVKKSIARVGFIEKQQNQLLIRVGKIQVETQQLIKGLELG